MNDFDAIRNAKNERGYLERRRKEDWVVRMATILSLVAWAVIVVVWFVLEAARPERAMEFINSLLRVHFDSPTYARAHWEATLLPPAFGLLIASLVICVVAFVFNKMRMKRKTDKYRKSIFLAGGITIIGIIAFLIHFGLPI